MGEVHAAVDLNLDRRVALKFIAPEFAADAETLKRFEREARSAAALSHPNIATLYAFEGGERPLIAMELLTGETLRVRLLRGTLPIDEALGYARDIAAGLALAHRRQVVHRDIKPENLMFDEDGTIKIVDFGLARAAQASRLTMTGSTLGTAAYMSPEAVRGESGPATDVWALGVILYEMLAGASPFGADDNPLAMMYVIANENPKPLRDARADVPEEVIEFVESLLAKDVAERPDAAAAAIRLSELTGKPLPPGSVATGQPETIREPGAQAASAEHASSAPTAALPAITGGTSLQEQRTEELEVERITRENSALPVEVPPGARVPARRRGRATLTIAILVALLIAGSWGVLRMVDGGRRTDPESAREALRLNNEGQQAMLSGDLAGAQALLEQAVAENPDSGPAMINLGIVYQQLTLMASAESLFTAALEKSENSDVIAQAHYNLGALDMDSGAWTSAIDHLEQSLQRDSSWAGPYNNLGYALVRAGRIPDGAAVLERGLQHFPGQPPLLKNHAAALMRQDRLSEALDQIDAALRLDPTYVSAHGVRAQILARQGDVEGAAREFTLYAAGGPPPAEARDMAADLAALGVTTAGLQPAPPPPPGAPSS
jgi:Tfp pilus assembly protein PilF